MDICAHMYAVVKSKLFFLMKTELKYCRCLVCDG